MIYHYPSLSQYDFLLFRFGGAGLANHLFPIYRAFQNSKEGGGEFLFPPLVQLKIGPFIRREHDKRIYFNLFNQGALNELMKLKVLFSSNKCDEFNYESLNQEKDGVIIYSGINDYFKSFNNEFREDFVNMLKSRSKNKVRLFAELSLIKKDDICVHIRKGDFPVVGSTKAPYRQISDDWYLKVINYLIKDYPDKNIRIFTDDVNSLSNEMLSIKNVTVDVSYNAWHALLKMSAHGLIVASASTFSIWSAFIGDQDVISNGECNLNEFINNEIQVI